MRAPIFSDNKIKNRERKRERKNHLHKIWWLRIFELNWCVSISTFDNHFFFLSKLFVCYFGVCSFGFRISFSLLCVFFFFLLDETKFSLRLICLRFSVTRTEVMVVLAILEWATLQFFLMSLNECWFSHCWFLLFGRYFQIYCVTNIDYGIQTKIDSIDSGQMNFKSLLFHFIFIWFFFI